jgi:hypothetical protein
VDAFVGNVFKFFRLKTNVSTNAKNFHPTLFQLY